MRNPTPTSKTFECPICSDTKGNCRQSERGGWFCISEVDAKHLDVVNGWKKVGVDSNKLWGIFVEDNGQDTRDVAEHLADKTLKASIKAEAERKLNASRMPVGERDVHYRAILSQLNLNDVDRADLRRRGFTDEQIERYGFKSVNRYQTLSGTFPLNLPGISKDGTRLDNWHQGYLCPATTADGQVQGFQIRDRHYDGSGAKYPWLSRSARKNPDGYTAHLQDGKLPVGVYWPDELRVFDTLGLCEGFALKPQLAANLLGMPVIGCDAANFASRPQNFKTALGEVKALLKTDNVSLRYVPDAGDISNAKVMPRIKRQFDLFSNLELEVDVLWWEQRTKASADIDEISREQFDQAKVIGKAEFSAMAPGLGASIQLETAKVPLAQAVFNRDLESARVETAQALQEKAERQARLQQATQIWAPALADAKAERDRIAQLRSGGPNNQGELEAGIKALREQANSQKTVVRAARDADLKVQRKGFGVARDEAKAVAHKAFQKSKKLHEMAKLNRDEAIQQARTEFDAQVVACKEPWNTRIKAVGAERDQAIDQLRKDFHTAIPTEINPLVIKEQRGATTVTVEAEATTVTVDSAFGLYQYSGQEKQTVLDANIQAIAIPGRQCTLALTPDHTHPGAIGTQIIAGTLLEKAGLTVTANGKPWAFWRSHAIARIDRLKHPEFYGLTSAHVTDDSQWVSFDDLEPGTILNLSAGCGLGKTTAVKRYLLSLFTQYPSTQAEIPGYRISLGQQATELLNLAFEAKAKETGEFSPLITYLADSNGYEQSGSQICAYPVDSFWRRVALIKGAIEAGRKVVLFIDELDAVLKHLADGGTLKRRQAPTYKDLCEVLSRVLKSGGNVITGEADLTQLAIDAIAQAAEATPSQIKTIEFTQPPKQRDIYFHSALDEDGEHADPLLRRMAAMDALRALRGEDIQQSAAHTYPTFEQVANEIDSEIAANEANTPQKKRRVLFSTTSQANAQRLEVMAREAGFTVERHDGKTRLEAFSKAFRSDPNQALQASEPDLVILTHSLESGVSIDIQDYFDTVILDGDRLEARALLQMSVRYREPIPVHAYVNQRALFADWRQETDPDEVVKEYDAYANDVRGYAGANEYFGKEVVDAAFNRAKTGLGAQLHDLKARYEARCNQSANNLRSHAIISFSKAGHNVTELPGDVIENAYSAEDRDAYERAREAVIDLETEIYQSASGQLEAKDAARVLRSGSASYEARVDARKCLDKLSYPALNIGTEDEPIPAFDDIEFVREQIITGHYKILKCHTLSWMSKAENHKVARLLDLKSLKTQIEAPFPVLSALRNNTAKLNFAEKGHMDDNTPPVYLSALILEIGEAGLNDFRDERVLRAAKIAQENRALINRHLRIQITEDTPPEIVVNKLLRKFGFQPSRGKNPQDGKGNRRWLYNVKPMAHQQAVWDSLSKKWADTLATEGMGVDEPNMALHFRQAESTTCENVTQLDYDPQIIRFRLKYCQSSGELGAISREIEAHEPSFDWSPWLSHIERLKMQSA